MPTLTIPLPPRFAEIVARAAVPDAEVSEWDRRRGEFRTLFSSASGRLDHLEIAVADAVDANDCQDRSITRIEPVWRIVWEEVLGSLLVLEMSDALAKTPINPWLRAEASSLVERSAQLARVIWVAFPELELPPATELLTTAFAAEPSSLPPVELDPALVTAVDERLHAPLRTVRISWLAYLRSMWNLWWSAIRHPFSDTTIDLSTGRVLYRT